MAGRRRRDVNRRSGDWYRSWLCVIAAGSGFALFALQPSVTAPDVHQGELVSAIGPDFQIPQDRYDALAWLRDAGILPAGVDVEALKHIDGAGDVTSPQFSDMVGRFLTRIDGRSEREATPAIPPTATTDTTTTRRRAATTTELPPTRSERPATTTTERPATTTTERPATTTTERPAPTPAPSSTAQAEQRFVELINEERSARGLAQLTVDPGIASVARQWTATMIADDGGCGTGGLRHNPDYAGELPGGWHRVAENVGCGQSVESLHRTLMASSGHRANILGRDFTHVGVGVGFDSDGTVWVTQNFAQY